MDISTQSVIRDTALASSSGRIHFGQVVNNLLSAGVESYHVDYRSKRISYYTPYDETLTLDSPEDTGRIAAEFSGDAIKSAILAAQRGEIIYPEFKTRSKQAGCVGYTVWLTGRHVSYYGRNGETHIERFPD